MLDTTLSEDLGRLLDHFAGSGPDDPPELSLVDHWVRSAKDLEDQVRRLTAERDEANERIRDLEKSVARLVERANRQRDRIGRAHDLLSGVDADV